VYTTGIADARICRVYARVCSDGLEGVRRTSWAAVFSGQVLTTGLQAGLYLNNACEVPAAL
jgi:hypothetical protein